MNASVRPWNQPPIVRLAQLAIGLVLLVSALGKLGDVAWFAQQVHNYRLLPGWAENALAIVLPWVELTAGLALVVGPRAPAGARIALALMVVFTVAVGLAWARGLDFRCGCFGKADASTIGASKFAENVGLTLLAWLAARRPREPERG